MSNPQLIIMYNSDEVHRVDNGLQQVIWLQYTSRSDVQSLLRSYSEKNYPVIFLSGVVLTKSLVKLLCDFYVLYESKSFSYLSIQVENSRINYTHALSDIFRKECLSYLCIDNYSCFSSRDLCDSESVVFLNGSDCFYLAGCFPVLPKIYSKRIVDVAGFNDCCLELDGKLNDIDCSVRHQLKLIEEVASRSEFWSETVSRKVLSPLKSTMENLNSPVLGNDRECYTALNEFVETGLLERFSREGLIDNFSRLAKSYLNHTNYSPRSIKKILQISISLHCSEFVVDHLQLRQNQFLSDSYQTVGMWFDAIFLSKDYSYFIASFLSAASHAILTKNGRLLYRLNSTVARLGTARDHLVFLNMIKSSRGVRQVLHDSDFYNVVLCYRFSEVNYHSNFLAVFPFLQDFYGVSVEDRVIAAIIESNINMVVFELSKLLKCEDLSSKLELLIPFSTELSDMGIKVSQFEAESERSNLDLMLFAALIGDGDFISTQAAESGDVCTVAMSQLKNYELLNVLLSSADFSGLFIPPKVSAENIFDVYDSVANVDCVPCSNLPCMVSVIITAYNPDLEFLRYSINSILAQTYQNFELIIVDDGSDKDWVSELKKEYTDSRIKWIVNHVNVGPYVSRNIAIHNSFGKYIAIQDADDYSHPQRLEIQVGALESSSAVISMSKHLRFKEDGSLQFESGFSVFGDGTMSSMFDRSVFKVLGDFVPVRSRGDVEYRERIKKYYGPSGSVLIGFPLIYCFAASSTLSHTIARTRKAALKLFRSQIDKALVYDGVSVTLPQVPCSLRPYHYA